MILKKRNGSARKEALILLAPDFREGRTVYCLERLRQAGISVSLVGLSARLIRGFHGMAVRPDITLDQLANTADHRLVLIPDGKECVSALFADPRVYQLIENTLKTQGVVAAMPEAETILERSGLVNSSTASSFVWRKDKGLAQFTAELISHLE